MGDARPPIGAFFDAFGVPATVTRPTPDDTPIETTGIWVPEQTELAPPGLGFGRNEPRKVLAFRRDQVPTLRLETRIVAPDPESGVVKTWLVDGYVHGDAEHHRVSVVDVTER